MAGPKRPWMAAGALLMLSLSVVGCGSQYRTVVTPVSTSGPPAQITSYAIVIAAPCTSAASTTACSSSNTTANAGTATLLDYSGDTIVDQAVLGPNPIAFAMDGSSTYGHVLNADNTISTFAPSTTLQTKDVQLSTLASSVTLGNFLAYSSAAFYLVDTSANAIDVMPGNPPAVEQTITPNIGPLVNLVSANSVQRVYAIGQGTGNASTACSTPSSVTSAGAVAGIDTSTNTVTGTIPVGICPVYGVMTADGRRAFILNRGSSTISVIDSQKNILDKTITLAPSAGVGPVYAEIVPSSNLLVTANYDDNSISVFKIDLDVYGNDSTAFGTLVAHVPVGTHPTSLTVLADGSRAYVANQGDGTVSIVNLTSFTVTKKLSVNGNPRTVVSAQDSIFGKVYVVSPNSKYCTIIRTDQDIVTTSILLPGYGVDVRMTKTSSTLSNTILTSRLSGSGQP